MLTRNRFADPCRGRAPRGWWCSRWRNHPGPCAARPHWWNLPGRWRTAYAVGDLARFYGLILFALLAAVGALVLLAVAA